MYKVTYSVQIPAAKRGRPPVYPFAEMSVGGSVLIEDKKPATIRDAVAATARRTGCKFTTRQEGSGLRVWRVA